MATTLPKSGTSRYPLTREQAGMLAWVRWAYAGMAVLAAAYLTSALWLGQSGESTLWTSVTGVVAFPVLTLLSARQLRRHRAALEEMRLRHAGTFAVRPHRPA
ncbi:hypothetical protein OG875_00605 [Streptomyces sp. NBC_01498]|uniref:hypothetical protein n=1 Tax=Streptomyces sp. NBC_01498 TaxID=2975870 RepID=UPI002E7BCE3E|nr:hypothetical protein [Streptomyces sp. NBC_01498]WTL23227.1 hypothetical protein OG875_00605 [Streptomyces sp. NBC_01498]